MIARLIISLATCKGTRQLTDQPSTRRRGIEQRILRSKDDFDSDASDSTSGKLDIGTSRGSLRSHNLKLVSSAMYYKKMRGLTMMMTKRYQFLLFNRKARIQSTFRRCLRWGRTSVREEGLDDRDDHNCRSALPNEWEGSTHRQR